MTPEYFDLVFSELTRDFTSNTAIKNFTNNPVLIGSYAEAVVRAFIKRTVKPLNVSTGAVISPEAFTESKKVKQIDAIIWSPCPVPAIFEQENFALIPRRSSHGVLEIKSRNYNNKLGADIEAVLNQAPLLTHKIDPQFPKEFPYTPNGPGLGVICLKDRNFIKNPDTTLENLFEERRACYILEKKGKNLVVNSEGVKTLVNFLAYIQWRHKLVHGTIYLS